MSIPVQQVEQVQLVQAPEAPATVTSKPSVYTAEKLQKKMTILILTTRTIMINQVLKQKKRRKPKRYKP
jgi:hypothetical protein